MTIGTSTINISNINQTVVFNISLSSILFVALGMTAFWMLLLAYLWPLNINVDEEKNLRFWYPFTSSYWCPPTQIQDQDQGVDSEVSQPLNPSGPLTGN